MHQSMHCKMATFWETIFKYSFLKERFCIFKNVTIIYAQDLYNFRACHEQSESNVMKSLVMSHEHCGVSHHQQLDCLFKLIQLNNNKVIFGGFPSQRGSNTESTSMSWHHHDPIYNFKKLTPDGHESSQEHCAVIVKKIRELRVTAGGLKLPVRTTLVT